MRASTIAAAVLALACACGLRSREIAFVVRDDLAIEVPAARSSIEPHGEAHELAARTADVIDGCIGPIVDEVATLVESLEDHRETRRDGAFRIYGPFADPQGRELVWVVSLAEDAEQTRVEVRLGPLDAEEDATTLAVHGHLDRTDEVRSGEIVLALDVLDRHRMLFGADADASHAGAVAVAFTRAPDDAARVEIDFQDFVREDDAGETWASDETFVLVRDASGGGAFHLVLAGRIDAPALGELDVDRLELDLRWDPARAGRTRTRLRVAANPDSALPHGDFELGECFDATGGLTWRGLADAYAADRPDYGFGDPASCVFADGELDPS